MKVLATADLHYNHPRSRPLAIAEIEQINHQRFDVLLLAGDTAIGDGDELERCLSSFTFAGPKAFICGNHELWTHGNDSYELFTKTLPKRVRALGWHWLERDPLIVGDTAFVGTIGWYDYSLAPDHLKIPSRFYEAKISPGAAARLWEHGQLVKPDGEMAADITEQHLEIVARWNDGRYVKLHRSDKEFLQECLDGLRASLEQTRSVPRVIAVVHHLPFRELLPPMRSATWDFVWAYLGAQAVGELLMEYPNVSHVLCGHTHLAMEQQIGHLRAINIGSGYRHKRIVTLELPDSPVSPTVC